MEKAAIIKARFIPLSIPLRDWKPNFLKAPGREEVALVSWAKKSARNWLRGVFCLLSSDFYQGSNHRPQFDAAGKTL
jgi:hypothetical protein